MHPTLKDGDFIIMRSSSPDRALEIGNVVILKRLGEPVMVKRIIARNDDDTYQLAGDGIKTTPRIDLNCVSKNQIIGTSKIAIGERGLFRL